MHIIMLESVVTRDIMHSLTDRADFVGELLLRLPDERQTGPTLQRCKCALQERSFAEHNQRVLPLASWRRLRDSTHRIESRTSMHIVGRSKMVLYLYCIEFSLFMFEFGEYLRGVRRKRGPLNAIRSGRETLRGALQCALVVCECALEGVAAEGIEQIDTVDRCRSGILRSGSTGVVELNGERLVERRGLRVHSLEKALQPILK